MTLLYRRTLKRIEYRWINININTMTIKEATLKTLEELKGIATYMDGVFPLVPRSLSVVEGHISWQENRLVKKSLILSSFLLRSNTIRKLFERLIDYGWCKI